MKFNEYQIISDDVDKIELNYLHKAFYNRKERKGECKSKT